MQKKKLSEKQRQILNAICKGNRTEQGELVSWLDMNQLLDAIPYQTSKDSMQFSLRHLIKRGFILNGETQLRRGRIRRTLVPTEKAETSLNDASYEFDMEELES